MKRTIGIAAVVALASALIIWFALRPPSGDIQHSPQEQAETVSPPATLSEKPDAQVSNRAQQKFREQVALDIDAFLKSIANLTDAEVSERFESWTARLREQVRHYNRDQVAAMLEYAANPSLKPMISHGIQIAAHEQLFDISPSEAIVSADTGALYEDRRKSFVKDSLFVWIKKNPQEALAWLAENDLQNVKGDDLSSSIVQSVTRLDKPDYAVVADAYGKIYDLEQREQAAKVIAANATRNDSLAAASEWLGSLSVTERTIAEMEIISFLPMRDPVEAVKRLNNLGVSRQEWQTTMNRMVATWARNDPDGCLNWVRTLPESGEKRESAVLVLRAMQIAYQPGKEDPATLLPPEVGTSP